MVTRQRNGEIATGSLSAKVGYLEKGIEDLRGEIASLRKDFNESIENIRGRGINWGWIIGAIAVVATLIGAILTPINSSLSDAKESFKRIDDAFVHFDRFYARRDDVVKQEDDFNKRIDGDVTRQEHEEFSKRLDLRDATEQSAIRQELDRINTRMAEIDGGLIKRPEITALLANLENRIDALSRNQDTFRAEYGATYTQGDVLKSLQVQVQNLEAKLFALSSQGPAPAGH